ncbi:unnamed protein product, partial [Prorocentrum cordatum]
AEGDAPDGEAPRAEFSRRSRDEDVDDPSDPPLAIWEWVLAGGVLLTIWCISVWRHNRREWLQALPLAIWQEHRDYVAPMGLLLSPFFFGNVPFKEVVQWMRTAIKEYE